MVIVAVVVLALVITIGSTNNSASSTSTSSSTTSTAPTTTAPALPSAAGKPCVAEKGTPPKGAPAVPVEVGKPPTKLVIKDLKVGTGAVVKAGQTATVNYIGVACSTGAIFDSSYSRNQPLPAQLKTGSMIAGWVQGVPGMKVGGERLLGIPSALAYGATGAPAAHIAPNEPLWFVVTVLSTK